MLCVVVLFSCRRQNPTLSESDKATTIQDVEQFFDDYFEAIGRKGLTAEFDYLDRSTEFFWVPPGYDQPISYDSVVAVLTQNAPQFSSVDNSFDSLRVIPLTLELATYTARLRSVMKDTSGIVSSIQLIETGVVIKRDGGWKLLNGQTSAVE